jgi:TfoX/Sxy family transcriptional regulator of competence genes
MTYDTKLADRIRAGLDGVAFVEKKMFGGVGFLIAGNMACGVNKNDLMVRVNAEEHEDLLKRPHVRPFDLTGKPMKGWLVVEADGCKTAKQLNAWIKKGVEFASTLPPK